MTTDVQVKEEHNCTPAADHTKRDPRRCKNRSALNKARFIKTRGQKALCSCNRVLLSPLTVQGEKPLAREENAQKPIYPQGQLYWHWIRGKEYYWINAPLVLQSPTSKVYKSSAFLESEACKGGTRALWAGVALLHPVLEPQSSAASHPKYLPVSDPRELRVPRISFAEGSRASLPIKNINMSSILNSFEFHSYLTLEPCNDQSQSCLPHRESGSNRKKASASFPKAFLQI